MPSLPTTSSSASRTRTRPRPRPRNSNDHSHWTTTLLDPWRRTLHSLIRVRRSSDLTRLIWKSYSIDPRLPVRVRPMMALLTASSLLVLAALGFHPTLASKITPPVPFSDKLLHFVCFTAASAQFYAIWNVDQAVRTYWHWKHWNELVSILVCGIWGSIGSEFVQSLLPYKTANILGTTLGITLSRSWTRHRERAQQLRRLYQPLHLEQSDDALDDEDDGDDGSSLASSIAGERMEEEGTRRGQGMVGGGVGSRKKRSESNPWDDAEDTGSIFGVGFDGEEDGKREGDQGRRSSAEEREEGRH
ncbi:BZ3500_MvSof-1268-A1-R1_Chr3-3g06480 [Microbotryum saponariae]|uniref:BZ3500_MvSof-1268-A1-R1_Chr3-3g06480 protein n=1 Tax=Microbotryum saponariae TaxID=289078 RepID=A0A2X0NH38_9BASI|nr:BZ3500_MvSof-1268-A1-R1_Chr3-3g06480 [Microbotryum saponariae]SDA04447.1 BZ3501_MvSof-1269-A2-R1_Chr3-2g06167 [Microbotryum saponariae]